MRQMPETLELLFFFMTEVTRDSEIRHLVADEKRREEEIGTLMLPWKSIKILSGLISL